MAKNRKHKTTKNTIARPPVTKLAQYTLDVNGLFTIVTTIMEDEFDKLYREWFDHPATYMWCAESLIAYLKMKHPKSICVLKEDYDKVTKGAVIPATKEEWEAENN